MPSGILESYVEIDTVPFSFVLCENILMVYTTRLAFQLVHLSIYIYKGSRYNSFALVNGNGMKLMEIS